MIYFDWLKAKRRGTLCGKILAKAYIKIVVARGRDASFGLKKNRVTSKAS